MSPLRAQLHHITSMVYPCIVTNFVVDVQQFHSAFGSSLNKFIVFVLYEICSG